MAFVTVARLSDLAPGRGVCVETGGKKLALFLVDGKCFAIDEFCPHRQAPLHEGYCLGAEIQCPWHATRFDLATGEHRSPPAKRGVTSYKVQIVADDVQVEV
jgi:nitrite reductase/ring-hydroxylating ferredoxin subunit